MVSSLVFDRILTENGIVEYLASRGVHPASTAGDGWKYACPLHDDDTPSFYVYPSQNGRPENYFCFGCKKSGHIVHLRMQLEGLTGSQAIGRMSKGMTCDTDEELAFLLKKIEEDRQQYEKYDRESLAMLISRTCYFFLRTFDFTEPHLGRCDRVFRLVDDALFRGDCDRLAEIYDNIVEVIGCQTERAWQDRERDAQECAASFAAIR